jgi:hypothetical protein
VLALAGGVACNVDAVVADDGFAVESSSSSVEDDSTTSMSSTAETGADTSGAVDSSGDPSTGAVDEGPKLDVASDETGAVLDQCDEEDAPDLIHVLTTANEIWTFDPIAVEFQLFTTVICPEADQISGFAIDRDRRITLISYEPTLEGLPGEQIMRVSQMNAGDAACDVVYEGPIAEGTESIDCADLALVASDEDPGHEVLYASRCTGGGFTIAPNSGSIWRTDLGVAEPVFDMLAENDYTSVPVAGTGDGRIFGISGDQSTPGSTVILEFDSTSGALVGTTPAPEIEIGDGGSFLALAFYGGDLYTFGLAVEDETLVHRYDWDDDDGNGEHDVTQVTELASPFPSSIFAAASPTCIPLGPEG